MKKSLDNLLTRLFLFGYAYVFPFYLMNVEHQIFGYLGRPEFKIGLQTNISFVALILFYELCRFICKTFPNIFHFYYICMIVPQTYYICGDEGNRYILPLFLCILFLLVFTIVGKQNYRLGNIRTVELSVNILKHKLNYYIGFILIILVMTQANFIINFDLSQVYVTRLAARETTQSTLLGYSLMWLSNFYSFIYLVFALEARNKILKIANFLIFSVCMLITFFVTAAKTSLFLYVVIILVLILRNSFFRRTKKLWNFVMPASFLILMMSSWRLFTNIGDIWIASLYSRLAIVPSLSPVHYVEFAHSSGFFLMRDWSVINKFYPFYATNSKGFQLGKALYNSDKTNLNSALFANAYLDGAVFAVMFFAIILGLFLNFLRERPSDHSINKDIKWFFAMNIIYWSIERSLNAMLISGGLLLILTLISKERPKWN